MKAKEKPANQKNENTQKNYSSYAYVAIAVVVALGIFLFALSSKPACVESQGISFCNGGMAEIKEALGAQTVAIHAAYPNENTSLPCELKAWLEVTAAVSGKGKTTQNFASINGEYCLNTEGAKVACEKPNILLTQGSCNCIKTNAAEKRVEIIGTEAFFCNNSVGLGAAIGSALSSIK